MAGAVDEVTRLQERVRLLAAGLGLDEDFEISDEVRRHVDEGRQVQAIRELRRQTSGKLPLVVAKRMVDALGR